MSAEEFFMILTIALIVLIPASVRVYRYVTARQMQRLFEQSFRKLKQEPREGQGRGDG